MNVHRLSLMWIFVRCVGLSIVSQAALADQESLKGSGMEDPMDSIHPSDSGVNQEYETKVAKAFGKLHADQPKEVSVTSNSIIVGPHSPVYGSIINMPTNADNRLPPSKN